MKRSAQALIEDYRSVLQFSRQMLEAAQLGDWEKLVEIEQARSVVMDSLRQSDTIAWPALEGRQKADMIRAILAADEEVTTRSQSRLTELKGMLGSVNAEQKLNKAYGL